jgi:L,D-transpeptidase catalytic domain
MAIRRADQKQLSYPQVFRWAAITILISYLVFRVSGGSPYRGASVPATETMATREVVPLEVRERLESVGWHERVGTGLGLWVTARWQRLIGIEDGVVRFVYPCSTAAKGLGNEDGSNQTPLGWHQIVERIGDGLPEGAVLSERKFTGRVWQPGQVTEKDFVLTRILWLRGLERGINLGGGVDSHERYIYIHGTPAEGKIGEPASMGCVRLKNRDVISLFDDVGNGTPVLITEW